MSTPLVPGLSNPLNRFQCVENAPFGSKLGTSDRGFKYEI